jgi:hypothetical protein
VSRGRSYISSKSDDKSSLELHGDNYVAEFLKEYQKLFPDEPIYVFSQLDEDRVFDGIKIHRFRTQDK